MGVYRGVLKLVKLRFDRRAGRAFYVYSYATYSRVMECEPDGMCVVKGSRSLRPLPFLTDKGHLDDRKLVVLVSAEQKLE